MVRPKKFLGQHFLKDQRIASRIVDSLEPGIRPVLEIGPGTGVLTDLLLSREDLTLTAIEVDAESVAYLTEKYGARLRVIHGDFLLADCMEIMPEPYRIIGNFPYNISSQIFFRILEEHDRVLEVVCMLQKEVADRICASHGSRTYGILSVLLQAYYHTQSLFKVPPGVFQPPPKVMSAVIRLRRNDRKELGVDEKLFHKIVKESFQKRRKTLRNGLKHLNLPGSITAMEVMNKRPEQLSVEEFIALTRMIGDSEGVRRI